MRWYLLMFDFINGEVCVLLLNAKCAVGVARCQQQPKDQTLGSRNVFCISVYVVIGL